MLGLPPGAVPEWPRLPPTVLARRAPLLQEAQTAQSEPSQQVEEQLPRQQAAEPQPVWRSLEEAALPPAVRQKPASLQELSRLAVSPPPGLQVGEKQWPEPAAEPRPPVFPDVRQEAPQQ